MPAVIIAGATGGIGSALVREYASRGWCVGLLGRSEPALQLLTAQLATQFPNAAFPFSANDVRDVPAVRSAFLQLARTLGAVDLVIYAAGVMKPETSGMHADFDAQREMFEVNTIGAMTVLELGAGYMQANGGGHLAAIGSIAGERGRKGNVAYGSSKAALHTFLEGMRNRLHTSGIRVSTIKPGFVNTAMLGGRAYPGAINADDAARRIATRLQKGAESFFVPAWWGGVGLAVRLCPSFIFKRVGPA